MKLRVDLYKPSGKWAYGGIVEISGKHALWSDEFRQELIENQEFVADGTFDDRIVVTAHTEEWERSDEPGFYQQLFLAGSFNGMRKKSGGSVRSG